MGITPAETLGRDGVWLVDLTFGGQVFRFGTRAAEVADDGGDVLIYQAGLADFDFDFSDSGIDLTIGIEIVSDIDWAALFASGVQLERAAGVLRRWFEDQTLDRARIIVRGIVVDVEYGAVGEAFELSIESAPFEQSDTLPPVTQTVGPDTWPVDRDFFDLKIEGAQYPIVIGFPGTLNDGFGAAAVPVLAVDMQITGASRRYSKILIAGHAVHASSVGLWDLTDTPASSLRPIEPPAADLLGQGMTHVNFGGAGPDFPPLADRSWYASFDVQNGGGLFDETRQDPLRGVGEVLRYFLRNHTRIPIDVGRMQSQDGRLNLYRVDTFINAAINIWDWLQTTVIPLVPVISVQTSRGLYWRFLDWDARPVDAVRDLSADDGQLDRTSSVRTLGDPIYNEITVEYAPFATSAKFRKRVIVTAQRGQLTYRPPGVIEDARIVENLRCRRSQLQFGIKPYTFKAPAVWDDATANLIARDLANRHALPHRRISYVGGPELESLEIGAVVTLTDSELAIPKQPALVFEVTVGDGREVEVDLVLIDSPINNQRLTG